MHFKVITLARGWKIEQGEEREISEESVRIIWAKVNVGLSTGNCRENEEEMVFKRTEAVNDRV